MNRHGRICISRRENASLSKMFTKLTTKDILIPKSFAITVDAFKDFIDSNNLKEKIDILMQDLDKTNYYNLGTIGKHVRMLTMAGHLSAEFCLEVSNVHELMFDDGI